MGTMRERPKTTTPSFAATVMLAVIMAAPANAQDGTQAKVQEAAAALVRGNPGQAVSSYTDALKDNALANDRKATILNDRAVAYVRLGQTKAAIEDFNKAVQLFPEYAATYNNRGNLLLALGLPKEALKDFDRAIVLAPGYVAAFNNRAGAHVKLGQQAEAIRDYTKAIELSPSNPAPLSGRGQALLSQGRPHAAIRDFSRAVNADARFASAYRSRGEAKLAIGRTEEAIEDLSRAIAFDSGNAEIYLLRGDAYLAGGNAAGAIKDFSRVIEIDQNSVAAYRARGLANSSAEAYDDALADLNRAIEIDPRSAVSFAYRAVVYKQANQADIGQKDLATAIKLDPNCAEVYWARAELAEAAGGQNDQAIADLRKALSLKPELRQASAGLVRLGAPAVDAEDKAVPGPTVEKWRIVSRGTAYFAVNDDFPRLRVPLEMSGEGTPRIIDWEAKKAPLRGIGVLRFSGGRMQGKTGPEEVELAAIIDTNAASVIAIEPHRLGDKIATWTWDEGKVIVASADGVTDEFQLRNVGKGPSEGQGGYRRGDDRPNWEPWRERPVAQAPRRKPKTIFDLLFNN